MPADEYAEMAMPADDWAPEDSALLANEILVTATKREQTLQDVPVAVTVISSDVLRRDHIRDLNDLQMVVPSLTVSQKQSVGNVNFFIRGFGNGANNVGIEPSVGVFVDNVYRSRSAAQITDLPEVKRIEVLRGPQSTLFGKNASAGVISITTEKPQFDFSGNAEFTYGNFDQKVGRAYVTGGLSDTVAASISGGINKRDGFYKDAGTGNRTHERDRWFVRGQMLFQPQNNLSVRLIGDYDKIDENCCTAMNISSGPATAALRAIGGRVNDEDDQFSGTTYNNYDSINDIENYGVSAQVDYNLGPLTLTSISAYRGTRLFNEQDSDFTSADLVYPNTQDLAIDTFTQEFRATASFADVFSLLLGAFYINEDIDQTGGLKIGSDFRDYANILITQQSGGALSVAGLEQTFGALDGTDYTGQFFGGGQGLDEDYSLDSEAFSLFGQLDVQVADGLTLTLGGNYTSDKKKYAIDVQTSGVFSSIDLDAAQYAGFRQQLLLAGALQQAGVDPTDSAAVAAFASDPATAPVFQQLQSYAAGNANNPAANPLGSLRGLQFFPPFLNVPNAVEDGKTSDNNFSYTVRLAYDVSPTVNVYASYATGFKASSINLSRDSRPSPSDRQALQDAGLNLTNLTFGGRYADPEKSRVLELGLKASSDLASVNLAVFHQQIKDFQSNIFTGAGFALRNAGKQSTYGAELESVITPVEPLLLSFGVTWLDPKYDSFIDSAAGDISGTTPAGIPEWTLVMGAQYEMAVGSGALIPSVSFLYQSKTQVEDSLPRLAIRDADGTVIDGTPATEGAKPFTRETQDLTASLAYELDNGLSFSVWGRNLLDKQYYATVFDSVAQPGGVSAYPTDPRTYGGTIRYRW
ncbi:TonB-dependent receptor [Altererythrobacter endophyticus]|uniref:TonB-dependent receptor n=2 Tax=Altericroceibacterium endophyticum TaxID=1808508 RepID=A0A6I4T212_9SPHN|nr:TonB-dependent receptor [Altericroceibacterium endophyticum]